MAAHELVMDPIALRRKNFIQPDYSPIRRQLPSSTTAATKTSRSTRRSHSRAMSSSCSSATPRAQRDGWSASA